MAHPDRRRAENVSGDLYVDSTCIDCDTCRWMAPAVYQRIGNQSAVTQQPQSALERMEALQALLSCPTSSIGTIAKPTDIADAQQTFPIAIADNVYHCGYHSEKSYGAASYLIRRPEGNILVDSPRFAPPLVERLEEMGGVRYLFLTHRDDVADHQKFRDRFGCDRILHQDEIDAATRGVEMPITGHDDILLAPELLVVIVPGHTRGHTVLLYRDRFLFSGDHLAWLWRLERLAGFRNACWYSWEEVIRSTRKLAGYRFEWVLPGHGRRYHATGETMAAELQRGIAWMETV